MSAPEKTLNVEAMEQTVQEACDMLDFMYGEVDEPSLITIRAMVLAGATADQIKFSITTAAVNSRVAVEDKSRYAFGVLRNIMMEKDDANVLVPE